jgi:FkbM family methyltransferase
MKYYSQYGQDRYFDEEIFKGKRDGFFVDIGAFDGINLSNTYFFEKERGWKGLCVEPAKKAFEQLKKNRSCEIANVCVSDKNGKAEFLEIIGPDDMLSGLYDKYDSRHKRRILNDKTPEEIQQSIQIECVTPNDLFVKYKITEVDFCSIDTEGSELDIVKSIDLNKYKIKYFTIENAYNSKKLQNYLKKHGYTLIRKMEYDDIYKFTGKQKYKNVLKQKIVRFFKLFGLNISALKLEKSFKDQKRLLKPKTVWTVFDAGANRGQTTAKYLNLFPKAKIFAFEPFPPVFESFKDYFVNYSRVSPEPFALSDTDGEENFFTNENHYTNSLLNAKEGNHIKNIGQIKVRTKRLDTYCEEQNRKHIDVLKMDVQGGEMKLLKGAERMLRDKSIDIIYTEVWFKPDYTGQPLFKDIKSYLNESGYTVYSLYNKNYDKDGNLVCADAIFISPQINQKISKK